MSNPIKKLLGQTAVYGLSSIVGRLLNYLLVPLYTYVFADPSDYGVVSELYAWVAFLVVFLTFGMETAFFRFLQDREDKDTVFLNGFLTVIGLNAVFFLFLLTFNQNIASWMLFADHSEYIILLGAIVCIDAVTALPLAKLRAENKAFQFASIQFASIGVNVILNLFLMLVLFDKDRPEEGVIFILVANLIASLVKPALLYKSFLTVRFKFDFSLAKQVVHEILTELTTNKLPKEALYNVNIPRIKSKGYKGLKICRQANAKWKERFIERDDPYGKKYYWLTGEFVNLDKANDTDIWALSKGYASVVPVQFDLTDHELLNKISGDKEKN